MTGFVSGHGFSRADPLPEGIGFSRREGPRGFAMSRSPAKRAMQFVPAGFVYGLQKEHGDLGEL